jgi:hypothetical protein
MRLAYFLSSAASATVEQTIEIRAEFSLPSPFRALGLHPLSAMDRDSPANAPQLLISLTS